MGCRRGYGVIHSRNSTSYGSSLLARHVRIHVLRMVHPTDASHVGTCLSMVDILTELYCSVLRLVSAQPDWLDRDRFILSKGHGAAAVYAILAERGFFPKEWLETYCQDGSRPAGHIMHEGLPGVMFLR
jgi:transketolase